MTVRDVRVELRVKPAELKAWRKAARLCDVTLSELIRLHINDAVRRIAEEAARP